MKSHARLSTFRTRIGPPRSPCTENTTVITSYSIHYTKLYETEAGSVDLMTVLGFIILVLALLWLFGWWLGQGEDLSRYDAPVDAVAWERFGQDGEPSEAHRRAEHLIREHGAQASGGSRKRMIELSREFIVITSYSIHYTKL